MLSDILLILVGPQWPWPRDPKTPYPGFLEDKLAKKTSRLDGGRVGYPKGGSKPPGFPKNKHRGPLVNGCVKKYK